MSYDFYAQVNYYSSKDNHDIKKMKVEKKNVKCQRKLETDKIKLVSKFSVANI